MKKIILDVRVADTISSSGFFHWIVFKDHAFYEQGRARTQFDAQLEAAQAARDAVIDD